MADDLQSGSGDPEQQLVADDHDTLQETVFSEDLSQPPEEDDWDAADEQESTSESSADGGDPTEDGKRDDDSPQQQSEPFIKVDGVNFRFPGGPTAMVVVAGISVAVAVARLVLRRVRRHRRINLRSIIDVVFDLPPSAVGEKGPVRPLEGTTFVVDTIIASAAGLKPGATPDDVPQRPLNAIDLLRNAGAHGIGQVLSEAWCVSPGRITPLMSKTPNPSFPKLLVLGAQAPAAAAVAGGVCDYALAPEVLGEARIAACSCGVACLRPSLAAVDSPGLAAMCPSLLTPAVLARDARALARAGAALGLPGSPQLTGLITRFLVLDDLFQQCDSQVQKSQKVLLKALAQWGGGDSLAQLPICKFLTQQMPSWRACLPAARHAAPMAPLEALAAAASAIMRNEMDAMTADWRPAEPVPARLSYGEGGSDSELVEAGDVMSAAQAVLRSSLRGDPDTPHVVVLPVLPRSPPPRAAASSQDFLVGDCTAVAELFCSIASLAGLPSVVLPVASSSSSSDRSPASGVMLVGAFRQDQQLLAVASKLQPVLEQVQQEVEAAGGRSPSPGNKSASAAAGTSSRASGAKAGKRAAMDEAVMAEAEKWKQQGNELFYKNECEEAVQAYSQALLLMPRNAKYLSNRAMALLKLGLYQEAEDDCTKALQEEISAKALLRRGTARMALQDWEGARKDYTQVLTLEPNNRQARDELRNLQSLLKDMPAATSATTEAMPEEMNGFW